MYAYKRGNIKLSPNFSSPSYSSFPHNDETKTSSNKPCNVTELSYQKKVNLRAFWHSYATSASTHSIDNSPSTF